MESRIYAEDPYRGFLPSIGRLVRYSPPLEGDVGDGVIVRNDAGVREADDKLRMAEKAREDAWLNCLRGAAGT
jgi:acetyl/propionyl-CoA carboxylase alpha subunit